MKISTTDMHTGGEPLRIITGGLPEIPGKTVLERRRYFRGNLDNIRTGLMWEPRGHADMYGVVITPPDSPDSDFGAFFLHNEGYSTMCGHAIIALARYAVETGLVKKTGNNPEIIIDVPAGRIRAAAHIKKGRVVKSSFLNVPSFIYLKNGEVNVDGIGKVNFDVVFGGAFYAIVKADEFQLKIVPSNSQQFIGLGRKIKTAVSDMIQIKHPFEEDLSFLYGTIFTGRAENPAHHSRNVCIFADGELDRSATGTGVSARAAQHYFRGELKTGDKIIIESILGTSMDVEIAGTTTFGPYPAVITKVTGRAWFTGEHSFIFENGDPLRKGFLIK